MITLGLVVMLAPAAPVEVQRPAGLDPAAPAEAPASPAAPEPPSSVPAPPPTAPSASVPTAPPPAEPTSPPEPRDDLGPPSDPVSLDGDPSGLAPFEPPPPPSGELTLRGQVRDREVGDAMLEHVRVELSCTCLRAPRFEITDAEGEFSFGDLPAGVYTVRAARGGPPSAEVVSLGPGQPEGEVSLVLEPPYTSQLLERRAADESRARTMLALGGVMEVAALGLLIATGVERAKPECKFDLDDCAASPRRGLAAGLGAVGGVLAVGGGALIGVGAYRLRKLRAGIAADAEQVAFVLSGRF